MKTFQLLLTLVSAIALFTFTSCNSDACSNSLCLNGGVCIDGTCDCPDRYTGADCSQQKTPDKIQIRTIKLLRFPESNEGQGWDANDRADLYFRLLEGDTPLAQPILAIHNAEQKEHHFFIDPVFMDNVLIEHTLQLRDFDAEDEDDIMGEIKFIPYQLTNGFPGVITWDDGGSIAFTVEVDYLYNKEL